VGQRREGSASARRVVGVDACRICVQMCSAAGIARIAGEGEGKTECDAEWSKESDGAVRRGYKHARFSVGVEREEPSCTVHQV